MPRINVRVKAQKRQYAISIGRDLLSQAGEQIRRALGPSTRRVALISNPTVNSLYGAQLISSLRDSKFTVATWQMGDGEHFKTIASAEQALRFLADSGLERTDAVVGLGGGVVNDLAGFAAAVYLRGVPFFQIPTTLLAQIDSSVGGKTGVNLAVGKNLVGSFHSPTSVITDVATLSTLPQRELVSGWCECVKQGTVGGRQLFDTTFDFLIRFRSSGVLVSRGLEKLVAAHCAFKASIVQMDEREDVRRTSTKSRRILNFGHTVAHALEQVTRYRRFRHGEAVGYGMLVAGELSKNLGLLDQTELELLRQAVDLCGPLPRADDLDELALIKAMEKDKKRVDGQIQWILLTRIGTPKIVDGKLIKDQTLKRALRNVLQT